MSPHSRALWAVLTSLTLVQRPLLPSRNGGCSPLPQHAQQRRRRCSKTRARLSFRTGAPVKTRPVMHVKVRAPGRIPGDPSEAS